MLTETQESVAISAEDEVPRKSGDPKNPDREQASEPLDTGFEKIDRVNSRTCKSRHARIKVHPMLRYWRLIVTDEAYPNGWPRLAAFHDTNDGLAIFRRFGKSHCRVLLHLQAEITQIEKDLEELDLKDATQPNMLYRLRRNEWKDGWDTAQKDLLEKLRLRLLEYGMTPSVETWAISWL